MRVSGLSTYWLLIIFTVVCMVGMVGAQQAWAFLLFLTGWGYFLARKIHHPLMQNGTISLVALLACLTLAEIIFHLLALTNNTPQMVYSGSYYREDPDLGYGPNPGVYTVKKALEDELVYEQTYTISQHGLRHIPGMEEGNPCTAMFFGGSITFGEGVGDQETMPYYFAQASMGKFSVFNFGFHGYGPHQMLRTLETARLPLRESGSMNLVIYQGIETHVDRAAGKATWDLFGPSYELSNNGNVQHTGPFHGSTFKTLDNLLQNSYLYLYIRNALIRVGAMSQEDISRYIAILKQVRMIVEETYGGVFVVLFWDKGSGNTLVPFILQELQAHQFHVIPISHIVPDIQSRGQAYTLSPHDPHPNSTVHRLIGNFLAERFRDIDC